MFCLEPQSLGGRGRITSLRQCLSQNNKIIKNINLCLTFFFLINVATLLCCSRWSVNPGLKLPSLSLSNTGTSSVFLPPPLLTTTSLLALSAQGSEQPSSCLYLRNSWNSCAHHVDKALPGGRKLMWPSAPLGREGTVEGEEGRGQRANVQTLAFSSPSLFYTARFPRRGNGSAHSYHHAPSHTH